MLLKALSLQAPCTTASGPQSKGLSIRWLVGFTRFCVLMGFFVVCATTTTRAVDVLTYHNDNARTGQNLQEAILTPQNVTPSQFGKLWTLDTDGRVNAEPLFVSGVNIPGKGLHDVVYVVSEADSVYAFDAASTNILWQVSVLGPGEHTSTNWSWCAFMPELGITATPVIDRQAGPNGTLFVEAMSTNSEGNVFQRIHALDLATGQDRIPPVNVSASYPGTGDGAVNGMVTFDPDMYVERACMLLLNGVVYTAWSAHCDTQPTTSWLIGFDENTLAQTKVMNFTPNTGIGSMWNSAAGPAADSDGNIYVTIGNSTFDASPTLDTNGFPVNGDYGNGFVKVSTTNATLRIADYFIMYNTADENIQDLDLSSGAPLVIPDQIDSQGHARQLVVTAAKDQAIYLADRTNMGRFNPNNNNALYQFIPNALPGGIWSMAAYFNGTLYFGPVRHSIMAFPFQAARLPGVSMQSTNVYGYPGTTPSISANGTSNAIVWAAETAGIVIEDQDLSHNAVLHAYSATNLAVELYNSNKAANGRDLFGKGNKFITPMIANGRVYVGTTSGVGVFGLINPPAIVSGPQSQSVIQNNNAVFSVTASNSPLAFQWRFNGGNISGATDTSYTVFSAQPSNVGSYSVVVTNNAGSVTSADAVLVVNLPPTFTSQPQSRTISQNTSITFTTSASGTAPLQYQWRFNGTNIANATNTSYTLAAAQFQDAGSYSIVITNTAGAITSSDALLTVHTCAVIHVLDISSNSNGGISITWPTDPGIAYTVQSKNDLTDAQWTLLSSSNAAGATITFTDSAPGSQRFYRVASDCAVSEPAGFIRLTALANSDTIVSTPFVRPIAAAATVSSVAGNIISVTQQYPGTWTANQFVYTPGTQPKTYYVRFVSGAAQGPVYAIQANDSSTLTVDISTNPLTAVSSGDNLVVEPFCTLNSLFPSGAGVNASPTVGNRNTEILIPDFTSSGINLSAAKVYFFNAGVWKQLGQGDADHGDDVVAPNTYLVVRHNVATNTTITTLGAADSSLWKISLRTPGNAETKQDNFVALARPVALSLNSSELVSSGAFLSSPLPGVRTDELLVFDNTSMVQNKSASAVYYFWSNDWRRVGAGSAVVGTNKVFTPGTGVIIRKSATTNTVNWTTTSPY